MIGINGLKVPVEEDVESVLVVRMAGILLLNCEGEWYSWCWMLGTAYFGELAALNVAEGGWKQEVKVNWITDASQSHHCDIKFLRMKFEAVGGKKCLEKSRGWLNRPQNCVNMSFWGGWLIFILVIFIYHWYCFLLKFTHCGFFMAALSYINLHQNWKELRHRFLKT